MKAAQDVWVRKGPKTTYDTMGSLATGKSVQVNYNGKTGYVCTDYLK